MQRRVEGTCLYAKDLVRRLLDVGRNRESVVRATPENLHHEEFQRALKVVCFGHDIDLYYRHRYEAFPPRRSSRGLLPTNLTLFSCLLQLPISLGMDLVLTAGEHVLRM
jgi:hypothetical protein